MRLRHLNTYGFVGVFTTVILTFLIIPFLTEHLSLILFLQTSFIFIILSSIYTLGQNHKLYTIGLFLFILFIACDLISYMQNSIEWLVAAYTLYACALLFSITILITKILRSTVIDTNLIFGAVTIYLLAGILWGKLFFLTDLIFPKSFKGIQHLPIDGHNIHAAYINTFEFLYYSFTNLTTLGVDDIKPDHRMAKSLTMLEAIFGQLFMATVIAKMVGVWRHKKESM